MSVRSESLPGHEEWIIASPHPKGEIGVLPIPRATTYAILARGEKPVVEKCLVLVRVVGVKRGYGRYVRVLDTAPLSSRDVFEDLRMRNRLLFEKLKKKSGKTIAQDVDLLLNNFTSLGALAEKIGVHPKYLEKLMSGDKYNSEIQNKIHSLAESKNG